MFNFNKRPLFRLLMILGALAALTGMATLASASGTLLAPMAPPPPPATYQYNLEDCRGLAANNNFDGSNPVVEDDLNGPNSLPCQSYGLDLYEDLEYGAEGTATRDNAQCADIEWFRIGSDTTWIYLEWDQVARNPLQCGSHNVAVEFDIDASSETKRSEYIIYGTTVNCTEGVWTDGKNIGWQSYFDANNNMGGADPGTGAACTSPIYPYSRPVRTSDLIGGKFYQNGQDGCSDKYNADQSSGNAGDGYEADNKMDAGDLVYCRWDGDKLHVAVKRTFVGIGSPDLDVRVRGWSDQQTSFDKGKFYEHDWKDPSFLGSDRRDNVDWNSGPTAVALRSLQAVGLAEPAALAALVAVVAVFGLAGIGIVYRRARG